MVWQWDLLVIYWHFTVIFMLNHPKTTSKGAHSFASIGLFPELFNTSELDLGTLHRMDGWTGGFWVFEGHQWWK